MPKKLRVSPSILLVFLFWTTMSEAQDLHPGHIKEKILSTSSYEYTFEASGDIEVVSYQNANEGQVTIEEIGINAGRKFIYSPESGFNGKASFVVAWPTVLNREVIAYTRIDISVVPSLLEAKSDYSVMHEEASIVIDVLSNDLPGTGATSVTGIELVQNGQASIENNQIRFSPDPGFIGTTSFVYNILDEGGYQVSGIVVVQVFGDQTISGSTLHYSLLSGETAYILLDDPSYTPSNPSGDLLQLSDNVWGYEAPLNYAGTEVIEFENINGDQVLAQIQVIDTDSTDDYVNDDEVFTSVGSTVTFDPFLNDYGLEGVLVDYSSELVWDGEIFSYTPEPNYAGYKEFFYTIFDGNQELTGIIEIFVGNFLPPEGDLFFYD